MQHQIEASGLLFPPALLDGYFGWHMSRYPFDYKAMLSDCPTFSLGDGGNKENGEKG